MSFRLDGKVAVVTGGATGIGLAIATVLCEAGAKVHLVDLDREAAETAAKGLAEAAAHGCDVSDAGQVERVFGLLGRVDILVNNAGIAGIGTVATTAEEDFERVFRVNVRSVFLCSRAVVAGMAARGGGVILNMASIAASSGLADRFSYSMSKGAVLAMTYSNRTRFSEGGGSLQCDLAGAGAHGICGWVPGEELSGAGGGDVSGLVGVVAAGPDGQAGGSGESGFVSVFGRGRICDRRRLCAGWRLFQTAWVMRLSGNGWRQTPRRRLRTSRWFPGWVWGSGWSLIRGLR